MAQFLLLIAAAQSFAGAPPDPCRDLGEMPSINAGSGNDRIYGGKIAYRVFGEKDRDIIVGSQDGEIHGGEDADVLVAYGGADRFVYDGPKDSLPDRRGRWSPKTGDSIIDFRRADGDRIDVSRLRKLSADASNAYEWSGSRRRPYSVWAKPRAGDTIVFLDIDGDARGDVVIRLLGRLKLSQYDFCGVTAPADRNR